MRKKLSITLLILVVLAIVGFFTLSSAQQQNDYAEIGTMDSWWQVQSIDTMKYSRDLAVQYKDSDGLDETIKLQVRNIAETGATHIAIGTPYDSEFLPFLQKWVKAARENGLKVWFRGNWSGWERWFGYERITPEEHIQKTREFIENNPALFEEADIFTACPECENGALGDPRSTGRREDYIEFLIEEDRVVRTSFERNGKNVFSNFNSMNLDVAKLIMDKETTQKLGGVVVIDHYVRSPERLAYDIEEIAQRSGGAVVLGEFGAPIPNIHGDMTETEQAEWVREALAEISQSPSVIGLNYWVNVGGSTAIWDDDGSPKGAVAALQSFYRPRVLQGVVRSNIGVPIRGAIVALGSETSATDAGGNFSVSYVPSSPKNLKINAQNYKEAEIELDLELERVEVTLESTRYGLIFRIIQSLINYLQNLP